MQIKSPFFQLLLATLILVVISLCLQTQAQWFALLDYDHAQLWSQPWRFFSAHLLHLNYQHGLLNWLALIMIVLIWQRQLSARRLLNVLLICSVVCCLLVWLVGQPQRFVGLSGILHGLIIFCLLGDTRQGDKLSVVVLIIIVAKIIAEACGFSVTGNSPLALPNMGQAVWVIHASGVIGGIVASYTARQPLAHSA
ncbi:rhombosortase [Idiomarina xiamenensis]|uniref:Membrane serine peptidase, rhomboid-like protein n=1 Tax=Idiomarina xiamenensis 10-D-4 TaxID=740709 RepID=K2JMK7_9GAMM|nr:rhombosortase [Idiomarina xiamenensis]EKE84751.1 membrane serine peptidase, rhomboid-like protein [Idiomarina xiamenensis 10-D-4]